MATGIPSFACPITSSAAEASSSAIAVCFVLKTYPNKSFSPLLSLIGFMPATPIATFISPSLKGRPWVSEIMTATSQLACLFISCLMFLAE